LARKWLNENGKRQSKIKYATCNVRGMAHKEEELNSILNENKN
jgi:hypothetical protein